MSEAINTQAQASELDSRALALQAINKIAPSWPLDKMIAVNPFWYLKDQRRDQVAAYLGALSGVHMHLREADYLELYEQGRILDAELARAAAEEDATPSVATLLSELNQARKAPASRKYISDLLDQSRTASQMAWHEELVHQISQFCAAHYQRLQPMLQQASNTVGTNLYKHWLSNLRQDKGIEILMSEPGLGRVFLDLPDDELTLIRTAIAELELDDASIDAYFHGLLLDINGWASYVSYLRWQQDLGQEQALGDDDGISILAIRLAWELALYRHTRESHGDAFVFLKKSWLQEQKSFPARVSYHQQHQQLLRVFAKALELSEQSRLQNKMQSGFAARSKTTATKPTLQAVFCIDVRSEVMRRALEAQHEGIETFGFAGFFGLPIAFKPKHTDLSRPQLPGLLAPGIVATPKHTSGCALAHHSHKPHKPLEKIQSGARWKNWGQSAGSGFSLVESAGWIYGLKLLKQTFNPFAEENPVSQLSHEHDWELQKNGKTMTAQEKAELSKGILEVIGIEHFADTVLLVGHGSHTANNLHAAGLDCGACGGQTGEVNVRVLAQLLNDPEIRSELVQLGVSIPETTSFVAALHNTTTDEITGFNELGDEVSEWLANARYEAQKERARLIDPQWRDLSKTELDKKFRLQSQDWSQVRPEWGLADNQAFIMAPRAWTKTLDLEGRVFLHDYREQLDEDRSVLELLMTAPMIVTNWINMQYNASVMDNHKYGSGNKVLHNAVGGNLGVFEGNAGDLRIGLSKQSVHNGERWMHTPQHLSVYIAASQSAIQSIVQKHEMLQELIENDWLFLFQWAEDGSISRYCKGRWETVSG